ncbi:uncharacterized protein LOC143627363 [Bidens hawaiensis]|uniref:uncharacterized protein LOC143627363 n=1 Tax=Bidens hawaiensis TaxID=980011 RepID=UPI004049FA4B
MCVCIQDGYIPPTTEFEGREQLKKYNKMEDDEKKMYEAESKTLAAITMALPQEILHTFRKYKTARELWEALESRYEGNFGIRNSKIKLLKTQFSVFKYFKNESLDDIITRYYRLMTELDNNSIRYDGIQYFAKKLRSFNTLPECEVKDLARLRFINRSGENFASWVGKIVWNEVVKEKKFELLKPQ